MAMIYEILLAFRPKTLTAALVPCVAGTALASATGQVDSLAFVMAILASFCLQIGTNLVNDSVDFVKGADTAERIGPRRITASGVMSPQKVMGLAFVFFFLAVLFGIPLVLKGGMMILVIGFVSLLMGYAYTAGPFPLAYLGLGDLFVIFFFGLIAVGGMFFIHTGGYDLDAFWLGLQIGLHATVLIAINNLRDRSGDQKVGKKTLAVRWGESFSKTEIIFLLLMPFLMNWYWWNEGFRSALWLPVLVLPLALVLARLIWTTSPGPIYNQFLGMGAGVHFLFGLLVSLGIWLG